MRKISYSLISILFVLQSMILPLSVTGGILCVSESHIAIEVDHYANHGYGKGEPLVHLIGTQHRSHDDICFDIPLPQLARHLLLKHKIQANFAVLEKAGTAVPEIPVIDPESRHSAVKLFKSASLLRSTVLII